MIYEALWGIDDWLTKGRENNTALYSSYRHTDTISMRERERGRETDRAGSSVMRLWLTSRTSSFFASHSQSGSDSIWFLQKERMMIMLMMINYWQFTS